MNTLNETAGARVADRRFSIVTGPLCEAQGVRLSMTDDVTFTIEFGQDRWDLPVTIKDMSKPTNYLTVSASKVQTCRPLATLLEGRLSASSSKGIEIHRIVAVVGRGADFTLNRGRLAAHHVNLNGGDNRIDNLKVVSTATHDRLHREHIDPNVSAYLASLAACPDGIADMAEDLLQALMKDAAEYEGHALPELAPAEAPAEAAEPKDIADGNTTNQSADHPDDDLLSGYNPVSNGIVDLSLSFDTGTMVVTATFSEERAETNDKGEPLDDDFGRPLTKTLWAPYTAEFGGELFLPGDPLPDRLTPNKRFSLEGMVGGEPRFSGKGIEAFVRGDAPPSDLAIRVTRAIDRRVAFQKPVHLLMVVAYVALSYVFPLARRCPFLAPLSELPGSGKTSVHETVERLAFNAHRMSVSSLAVTVRLASQARCTLLLDEAEKLASHEQGGDLIEVLNARADAGAVFRNLGHNGQPRSFELFGPAVISNLGGLSPTLRSRSLVIEMQPIPNAGTRHQGHLEDEDWVALRDGLLLWAGQNWRAIKESYDRDPAMNVGGNRHADLWRLPLAVAKHFGGTEMFEALYQEALETAASPGTDDLQDAMAIAIANTIAEQKAVAHRTGSKFGAFEVALQNLYDRAAAALEEDRRKALSSKQVAKFARSFKLETPRSSKFNGATAVAFATPQTTVALLHARFPHLVGLMPQVASSAP